MKKYYIEAEQLTGWLTMFLKYHIRIEPAADLCDMQTMDELAPRGRYFLPTSSGDVEIEVGDYIARKPNGDLIVIPKDVLEQCFNATEEEATK